MSSEPVRLNKNQKTHPKTLAYVSDVPLKHVVPYHGQSAEASYQCHSPRWFIFPVLTSMAVLHSADLKKRESCVSSILALLSRAADSYYSFFSRTGNKICNICL